MPQMTSSAGFRRKNPDPTSRMSHQASLISDFDAIAGREDRLNVSLDAASRIAAEGVGSEVAAVFQYQPDEQVFVLRAATGLYDCLAGRSWSPASRETATGVAWHTGCPVLSGALDGSFLFAVPQLLKKHGVIQAVSVAIPGSGGEPYGVLEIGSPTGHHSARYDIPFLRLLAQKIGSTVDRYARQPKSTPDPVTASHGMFLAELRYLLNNEFKSVTSLPVRLADSSGSPGGFEQIGRQIVALAAAYAALQDGADPAGFELDAKLCSLSRRLLRIAEAPPSESTAGQQQIEIDASHQQDAALSLIASLTGRQRQIMALVLEGHPSKNIAADLGISQRTVENHRASIMARTGTKSLPALARMAFIANGGCLKNDIRC